MPVIAVDNYSPNQQRQLGPHDDAAAVTKSDTDELVEVAEGFLVGADGNIVIKTARGTTLTIAAKAGVEYRIRIRQVLSTNTTATGIVALY
ncbi:spike base protein, RCAP_Rcc01079 family [Aestuariivirga sp. YIM B02566]|uniref:Uncharacterized protein n=1 Tax=Taklimakanibacter albus TaxID=2800327 RepID=A0ACC5RGC6_9HYPH|nr:hypothetical protein [Aestuariivirga sp. YIM B02566]MBK1871581.1 hypothetical protein [Aestuariivirga sp. YIM B02566]